MRIDFLHMLHLKRRYFTIGTFLVTTTIVVEVQTTGIVDCVNHTPHVTFKVGEMYSGHIVAAFEGRRCSDWKCVMCFASLGYVDGTLSQVDPFFSSFFLNIYLCCMD